MISSSANSVNVDTVLKNAHSIVYGSLSGGGCTGDVPFPDEWFCLTQIRTFQIAYTLFGTHRIKYRFIINGNPSDWTQFNTID